jgi:isopenicillin-N N-acyltransferase-like protein
MAKKEVLGSLSFYTAYYEQKAKMNWAAASTVAENVLPLLERDWPDFVEEMKGRRSTSCSWYFVLNLGI